MATSTIDAGVCERLVNAATAKCAPPPPTPPPPAPQPEWDALANSFASLSAAFTWGSILLALLAVIAVGAWGFLVKVWAEREARKEAAECVRRQMDRWLADEAPGIVRQHVENLRNASLGSTDDDAAADEMGKEAG